MKSKLFILMTCILIQGCSKLDDYFLGKDNTDKPRELEQIEDKFQISSNWAVTVGSAIKNKEYLRLKPVIYKNIIYTADMSGLVLAVEKNNGGIKWSTQLEQQLVSGPVVEGAYVAVCSNRSSLIVLDQADGKKLWQTKVSGEILSPPTITSGIIIVKTINGRVYAFKLKDGKQIWMTEHGSPSLVLKASSSPVVMGDKLLIGFADGKLEALELQTGRVLWQRSIAYASGASDIERLVDIDADPIVENNVVYLASYQGYIAALSLADGQFIWRKPASVYKNLLLIGNTLYFTDSHEVLWSVDKRNGRINWKNSALKARVLTEPALIKDNLLVGDQSGYLHFIEVQTGKVQARFKTSAGVSVAPNVIGERLYVLTDDGILHQLSVGS